MDYFRAQTLSPGIDTPLEAPLGSPDRPLGSDNPRFTAGSYLLGLKCGCGQAVLVYSNAFHADEPLACPHCAASFR